MYCSGLALRRHGERHTVIGKSPGLEEKTMLLYRASRFAILIVMSALMLPAQTGSGTVQGVVRDAASALIAGANVSIVNTATGSKTSTPSNDVGFFMFPPMVTGPYEIKVEVSGMETWGGRLLLQVGQTAEVSPVLRPGSLSTQVTVAGERSRSQDR